MHALPFEDNSFDVLILGWVLGYSKTPGLVAKGIVRVSIPGAIVSIGNDCYTRELLAASNFAQDARPQTVEDLLNCFGSQVGQVFFTHEPHYSRDDIPGFTGHVIATFEIRK
jgi:ubiquinone/menaquinone biosynthesis C-methylase UbiE